jgi:hypothetical protein
MWLTAYEFWRGRAERLLSRWPAIFILFANGAVFLLRSPLIAQLAWPTASMCSPAPGWRWSAANRCWRRFRPPSLLAMAKERAELRHKTAATTDPLTGLANVIFLQPLWSSCNHIRISSSDLPPPT